MNRERDTHKGTKGIEAKGSKSLLVSWYGFGFATFKEGKACAFQPKSSIRSIGWTKISLIFNLFKKNKFITLTLMSIFITRAFESTWTMCTEILIVGDAYYTLECQDHTLGDIKGILGYIVLLFMLCDTLNALILPLQFSSISFHYPLFSVCHFLWWT